MFAISATFGAPSASAGVLDQSATYQARTLTASGKLAEAEAAWLEVIHLSGEPRTLGRAYFELSAIRSKRGNVAGSREARLKAAENGNLDAINALFDSGNRAQILSNPKILAGLEEQAGEGELGAQIALGDVIWQRSPADRVRAEQLWQRAAAGGNLGGFTRLGRLAAFNGDIEKAADYLSRNLGTDTLSDKLCSVSRAFAEGRNVPRNAVVAAKLEARAGQVCRGSGGVKIIVTAANLAQYEKSAAAGVGEAAYAVARYYRDTQGDKSGGIAAKWFVFALSAPLRAEDAFMKVQTLLPFVNADSAEGKAILGQLSTLSEKGDTVAIRLLALLYSSGILTAKDNTKAVLLWERAAQKNDAESNYRLGTVYAMGQGVDRDPSRAKVYLEKAKSLGHPLAQTLLSTL